MIATAISPRTYRMAGWGLLLVCGLAFYVDRGAFCAAWLTAWWVWAAIVLGAQANLYLHGLTGGSWMASIRPYLQQAGSRVGLLALLLVPVAVTMPSLYPWAADGWIPTGALPAFKAPWLDYEIVLVRLLAYALLWVVLQRGLSGSEKRIHAASSARGLIVYGFTMTLAAVDLVMSLTPDWYSSGFGLVVITAQMKAGLAWAVLWAAKSATPVSRRDLGNLLLMYVLMWAYLAFTQFQIIWAENLPSEIIWYTQRLQTSWRILALALVITGFAIPMMLLLFRAVKQNATSLRAIALVLCVMNILEALWLIAPSIDNLSLHFFWLMPLVTVGMGSVLFAGLLGRQAHAASATLQGAAHAD